ncbi:MAG: Uma2 family endonuclease [Crocosphaera sp.]|nr:Uma2 family endonuclease [Crocosphaera sp.]
MLLTRQDLQEMQSAYPDYRLELVDGEIIVMSPSGYASDEVATEFARQLANWVKPRKLGRVTASSAGFNLPDANIRSPDVSFVKAERLKQSPRSFADLAPDLMVEVKSPTDSLTKTREKIQNFLNAGTQVGILVNPDERIVEVYRNNYPVQILQDGDHLTLPDLLPDWTLLVSELWPVEFD